MSRPDIGNSNYLRIICLESEYRGYSFNQSKIKPASKPITISVTHGQVNYEWLHLMSKLMLRSPVMYEKWRNGSIIEPHPLFDVQAGEIEPWERQTSK